MTGMILTYLGLILTIGFGVYAIIINRKTQKKVSISFKKEECYSLFKEDINRLNIDVNYKGQSVNNFLLLFKGTIENNGTLDIDKNRIYTPLKIITKKEFKWLETSISSVPDGATVKIDRISDNTIEFNWDLIKKGEQIDFEALVEIPVDSELEKITDVFYDSIKFDFRITDLSKVDKIQDFSSKDYRRRKLRIMLVFLGVFTLLMGISIFFSSELPSYLSLLPPTKKIEYQMITNNDTLLVELNPVKNNTIRVKNDNFKTDKTISDFNKEYQIIKVNNIIIEDKMKLFNRIMGSIYILTSLIALWRPFKKRKLPPTHTKV